MKKKILIFALFLFCEISSNAQISIDELIQAEKSFAAYSVVNGTKDAFLKFADSAGVVFDNGKPVNAIETWNKREKRPGVLNWYPQYAEVDVSGKFGYTSGPWTFQNSLNDTVVARGQYTTVWHKNEKGEWKFLVDLGIGNSPMNSATEVKNIYPDNILSGRGPFPHNGLITEEENFLKLVSVDKSKAYKKYLSGKSILNRNGYLPAAISSEQTKLIELTPSSIQYETLDWEMSGNLDLGFVYGKMVINNKAENYLRIWRWEIGGWKIALEVLRY